MKKVGVYLGINSSAGGMFQYSQALLTALEKISKNQFNVIVITSDHEWKKILDNSYFDVYFQNSFFGKLFSKLLVLFFIPPKLSIILSKIFNPIARFIYRLNLDLIIFPNQDYFSFQLDVKSISSIHDLMHLHESRFPEVSSKFRFYYREYRYRNITRFSNAILVDSHIGKDHVLAAYKINSHNVYPLPYIAPMHIYNNSNEFDLSTPKKYLFYPAQFWEHKNHLLLMKAIAKVKEEHDDIKLILTGRKNHNYKYLKQAAVELNIQENIIFNGKIKDEHMSYYYKNACALIFPSFFGPTNIPPLEALVCGCPMAVSDIYGMREQLKDAALYFNPLSSESISSSIKLLWCDDKKRNELINNGIELKAKWSIDQFSERLLQIICKVIK